MAQALSFVAPVNMSIYLDNGYWPMRFVSFNKGNRHRVITAKHYWYCSALENRFCG